MTGLYQLAATEIPGGAEPPAEIRLLPAGRIATRLLDGRGPFENPDADAVVAASREGSTDLVVDFEHQTQLAPRNGQPAPAAGWIKRLFARDGEVWAEVDWTERGAAALRSREYRYLSPVIEVDKATGRVRRIITAALTNNPALDMPALLRAEPKEGLMDLTKLKTALGLPATATEEEVLAAAARGHGAVQALAAHGKALGLEGDVTAETVTTALTAQQEGIVALRTAAGLQEGATLAEIAAAVKPHDPKDFVPRSEFERLSTRLSEVESAAVEDKAVAAVDGAIAAGKFPPAVREHYLAHARRDLADFERLAAATPALIQTGRVVPAGQRPGGPSGFRAADGREVDQVRLSIHERALARAAKDNIPYVEAAVLEENAA